MQLQLGAVRRSTGRMVCDDWTHQLSDVKMLSVDGSICRSLRRGCVIVAGRPWRPITSQRLYGVQFILHPQRGVRRWMPGQFSSHSFEAAGLKALYRKVFVKELCKPLGDG